MGRSLAAIHSEQSSFPVEARFPSSPPPPWACSPSRLQATRLLARRAAGGGWLRRLFSGVVALSLLVLFSGASCAQNVPNADLLEMKGHFLKQVNDDKAAITRDENLLTEAEAAHQQALSNNDSDGAAVTLQATQNALQALEKARLNLADDRKRLDAVNQALVLWHSVGDSIGPRALATIVRGTITVDTPQGSKPFDPYAPIHPGQHILLGPDAFLELQLGHGSEMHLGPGTDFEYERDVQGVQWEVFKGELHKITVIMGVRGANDDTRYRGATAICAVRGTDFTLSTDGNKDTVTVLEGSVEVDPGSGRPTITLTGGQQLTVPKSGAVVPATTINPATMRKWWEERP